LAVFGIYFGRFYAQLQTAVFCICSTSLCFIAWIFAPYLAHGNLVSYISIDYWFTAGFVTTGFGFIFNNLTVTMISVVVTVASFVHLYAMDYMRTDPHLIRFLSYLSVFTFCMLMLVSSDNLVQFFLSWEGVGVCSYLLINFWFTRVEANKSALKALILNRVGDFFLLCGVGIIFFLVRSFDFTLLQNYDLMRFIWEQEFIFSNEKYYGINRLELAALCFFLGAVGKSAQIGLHTWLPDAMEGPTPVSALIHAATMVTAGVFLIIRCSFLFEFSENLTFLVTFVGLTTAVFAGSVACFQYDIKKVIAYSTCSQLGYMVFSCGLHQYLIAFFHLLTHAFFKALLFLTAGAVIHFLGGEQDLRKMGGIYNLAPLMSTNMLIGTLALTGFPFLAGYYSKDAILENSYAIYNNLGVFVHLIALLGALITSYYSIRLYYLVYFGKNKTPLKRFHYLHKMTYLMSISLFILSFFSIFAGYLLSDKFIGIGSLFFVDDVSFTTFFLSKTDLHFILPVFIKFCPIFIFMLSLYLINLARCFVLRTNGFGYMLRLNFLKFSELRFKAYYLFLHVFRGFFNKRWFFDSLYNRYLTQPVLNIGYKITYVLIDKGFIEFFGPQFFVSVLHKIKFFIRLLNKGQIKIGFRFIVIGFFLILFFTLFYTNYFLIK
jgi:proton-translocating NADH-quinone oxidoreductase chain L